MFCSNINLALKFQTHTPNCCRVSPLGGVTGIKTELFFLFPPNLVPLHQPSCTGLPQTYCDA